MCAVHACQAVTHDSDAVVEAIIALGNAAGLDDAGGVRFGDWNDTHTKEQVFAAFDKAIAEVK